MAEANPAIKSTDIETDSTQLKEEELEVESSHGGHEILLPGLPTHLSILCLSLLHPSILYAVCHSWRRLIYSPSFPSFFSLYALLSPLQVDRRDDPNQIEFFSIDPFSTSWQRLPDPPQDPPLRLLHCHPSFLSRNLPIQSVTISDNLVLIAGTTHGFLPALSRPLVFNPKSCRWLLGPRFSVPRRWCATGSVGETVYLASGVGSHYHGEVARTVERWDMKKKSLEWDWEKVAPLQDGRFSREAVDAVGYRGKLHMVNVKGNAVKQDAIYNVEMNRWEQMPKGMIAGWKGPAAAMNEETLFVVDEDDGVLSRYDQEGDRWEEIMESVLLEGVEQISAGGGRVCAVCRNGVRVAVIDVTARPAKLWVVEPPPGMQVVATHILPKMNLHLEL